MSLAGAIKKNSTSLAAAQTSYKQDVVAVNQVITAVLASRLPTLNDDPPDWSEFVIAYEQANGDALTWVNQVMGHLLSIPDDVKDYNGVISQVLADAVTQATALVAMPSNRTAQEVLDTDLTTLTQQFDLVATFISTALNAVQNFQTTLPAMATQLQIIAQDSATAAGADEKQIQDLTAAVQGLQDDINSLTAQIVALAIADGVALTMGVVATIVAWPFGAAVWLMLGPVVAAATTLIALDSQKIVDDKNTISADEKQITGISADVATLNLLANQYTNLSTQAQTLTASLQAILAEWRCLGGDVAAAVSDIRTAMAEATSANFQAVLDDVNTAIGEWNAAYAQAGTLELQMQVNTAQLELGMSASQLQAALASGQTIGAIEYWNGLGARRKAAHHARA